MGSGAGAPEAEGRSPWNRRGQLHLSENRRTKNSPEMPGGFFFFFQVTWLSSGRSKM